MITEPGLRVDRAVTAVLFVLLALALGGCGGDRLKQTLGIGKQPPDEYQVVRRAPLSLPPDFDLRPPAPGAARPQELEVRKQAEQILTGQAAAATVEDRSTGEVALLQRAGALDVDSSIRQVVDAESAYLSDESGFVDQIMFWRTNLPDDDLVDAAAEAERLRQNAQAGLPVTEGETPIIRRKDERAPLEGLNPF
jgi:hypothetical protein